MLKELGERKQHLHANSASVLYNIHKLIHKVLDIPEGNASVALSVGNAVSYIFNRITILQLHAEIDKQGNYITSTCNPSFNLLDDLLCFRMVTWPHASTIPPNLDTYVAMAEQLVTARHQTGTDILVSMRLIDDSKMLAGRMMWRSCLSRDAACLGN